MSLAAQRHNMVRRIAFKTLQNALTWHDIKQMLEDPRTESSSRSCQNVLHVCVVTMTQITQVKTSVHREEVYLKLKSNRDMSCCSTNYIIVGISTSSLTVTDKVISLLISSIFLERSC